jgi:hypothetical protein
MARSSSLRRGSPLHGGDHGAACEAHFDFGLLREWEALGTELCPAGDGPGRLRCRVTRDAHLPPATAPHTLCDAHGVVLRPALWTPTQCLAHRSGYGCGPPAIWWALAPGGVASLCAAPAGPLDLERFPRDHLRDVFAAWATADPARDDVAAAAAAALRAPETAPIPAGGRRAAAPVTLWVARERGEHANLFHATTDMLNAFMALHVASVLDAERDGGTQDEAVRWVDSGAVAANVTAWADVAAAPGAWARRWAPEVLAQRDAAATVGVLLMDEQAAGPFDALFARLFAPEHGVQRGSALKAAAGADAVVCPRVVFSPPGYTNFLFAHLFSDGDCTQPTHLLRAFRRFASAALGLAHWLEPALRAPAASAAVTLRVTVISRRPYQRWVDHSFVGRQVDNEAEVLEARLRVSVGATTVDVAVAATLVDLVSLSAVEQAALVARSDVLVGMHGAALSHVVHAPPWAALLELWPKTRDMWRCFEHLAHMAGAEYARWANAHPAAFRTDERGDYTRVDVGELGGLFRAVAERVARRMVAWAQALADDAAQA